MINSLFIGGSTNDFQFTSNKNRYYSSTSTTKCFSKEKLEDVIVSVMRIDSFRTFYKGQFLKNVNFIASKMHDLALRIFTTPAWLVKDVFTLPFKKVTPSFTSNLQIIEYKERMNLAGVLYDTWKGR
jgi:hypothetical protein